MYVALKQSISWEHVGDQQLCSAVCWQRGASVNKTYRVYDSQDIDDSDPRYSLF